MLRVRVLAELFVGAVCAPLAGEDLGAQLVPAVGEVAAVAEGAARHVVLPVPAEAHPVEGRPPVGGICRGGGGLRRSWRGSWKKNILPYHIDVLLTSKLLELRAELEYSKTSECHTSEI